MDNAPALLEGLGEEVPSGSLRETPESMGQVQLSFAPVVELAAPAVVNVYATRMQEVRNPFASMDPFFRRFFGDQMQPRPRERMASSLGSGVIVDSSGLIVTNNHVIEQATDVRVSLADRREYAADILIRDERTDLAVLQVRDLDEPLPALAIGASDALEVGDVVLAIGNPFGVGQTVTQGIVSALARTQVGVTDFQFFIQTDAAINPGNSGGALVTTRGELVGINSAIASESGGFQGIGLAIPSRFLTDVVDQILTRGRVVRGWLGVAASSAPGGGVIIGGTLRGGPADRAGVEPGDLLVAIDGEAVADARQALDLISSLQPGSIAVLTIRRDGRRQRLEAMVSTRPQSTGP